MNYYERYMGDYQRDTGHLSLAEHGVYAILLDTYYSAEKPLPPEIDRLYRLCRAMTKDEQAAVRMVVDEFFPLGDDGLRHNFRADVEIAHARPRIEAAKINGKKGGRRRKSDKEITQQEPSGFPTGTQQEPSRNPAETQNEPTTKAPQHHTPTPIKQTPQPPKGGEDEIVDDKSPGALTFKAWIRNLKARSETPIPPDDPIYRYCDEVGIPSEFLAYHWHEFKQKFMLVSKRQRDWRSHFRNSVRGNWLHVWSMPNGSEIRLTTVGEQARRAIEAAQSREAEEPREAA